MMSYSALMTTVLLLLMTIWMSDGCISRSDEYLRNRLRNHINRAAQTASLTSPFSLASLTDFYLPDMYNYDHSNRTHSHSLVGMNLLQYQNTRAQVCAFLNGSYSGTIDTTEFPRAWMTTCPYYIEVSEKSTRFPVKLPEAKLLCPDPTGRSHTEANPPVCFRAHPGPSGCTSCYSNLSVCYAIKYPVKVLHKVSDSSTDNFCSYVPKTEYITLSFSCLMVIPVPETSQK